MKISSVLLIVGMLSSFARGYSQSTLMSLDIRDGSLTDVFTAIERSTEYKIFYKSSLVDKTDLISIQATDKSVSEVLSMAFSGRNLSFDLVDKVIIISEAEKFQKIAVSGLVTDASTGEPLTGVYVMIEGTRTGVVTDANGKYSLEVPDVDSKLVFSFIGYNTEIFEVSGRSVIDVSMLPDIQKLEEVVVIGYGTMKKSDLTGAIVSVSGDHLNKSIVSTLDQALQGKAAGVQVINNSGQPGSATSVRIRGINSLQTSNEPLYVIDGIQVSGNNISTLGFVGGGGNTTGSYTTNPLSSLNPADIESIEVLKDASACAIYGNQGANGVIIVTTKHGRADQSRISYDVSYGFKKLAKKIDVLNLREYAAFSNELYAMKGLTLRPEFSDPASLSGGTDWQEAIFQTAHTSNHQLSFSGGNEKTTFYLGLGSQNDEGIVLNSWFKRYSLRLNLENKMRSWFKVGSNLSLGKTSTKLALSDSDNGPIMLALVKAPDIPVRDEDGNYAGPNDAQMPPGNYSSENPVALTEDRDTRQQRIELLANSFADLTWKNFTFRNEMGISISAIQDYSFSAEVTYGGYTSGTNQLAEATNNQSGYEFKNILTYNREVLKGQTINLMIAHEARAGKYNYLSGSRSNFLRNSIHQLSNGDSETQGNSGYDGTWRSESYLGRLFYNFKNFAMLTASYRFDGSSKFAAGKKWGGFPSVSGAFRLSNLDFFKKNLGFFENFKINASYGETGNSSIEDYLYLASVYFGSTTLGQSAYLSLPNPNITWETTKSSNLGLEIGVLHNRISMQFEVYKKRTVDALNNINLPDFLGSNLGTVRANAGSVQNKGFEVTVSSTNMNRVLNWKTDFTFTMNRNKVVSLGLGGVPIVGGGGQFGEATSYTIEGGPIGRFYGYVFDGLYQNLEDILLSARWSSNANDINPGTGLWIGDAKFKDIDKSTTSAWEIPGYTGEVVDGVLVPGTARYTGNSGDVLVLSNASVIDDKDRTFIGDPNPKFVFGLGNTFAYKNFDLTVFINGVYGNKILNYNRIRLESMYTENINYSAAVINRAVPVLNQGGNADNPSDYTLKNPKSSVPRMRIDSNPGSDRISTRFIEDGSYLRIQNVVLGYNLPQYILEKTRLNKFRIYINAQNICTLTDYSGYDPEIGNQGQSSLLQGVDNGHYPLARSIVFGAQVEF